MKVEEIVDYGFEYDFISPTTAPNDTSHDTPAEPEDESYEFRLFAPASKKASSAPERGKEPPTTDITAPKITLLRSPSPSAIPTISEGRLLRPRPESHYFATTTATSRDQYSTTAVSTTNIFALSQTPWRGTSLPWRVIHLPSNTTPRPSTTQTGTPQATNPTKSSTRSKPNKKRRIILRRRLAARTAASTKSKAVPKPVVRNETGEIISLDPAEREKRSARNKEKKLKRRQRERERKAALAGGEVADGGDGGGSDDGDGGGD